MGTLTDQALHGPGPDQDDPVEVVGGARKVERSLRNRAGSGSNPIGPPEGWGGRKRQRYCPGRRPGQRPRPPGPTSVKWSSSWAFSCPPCSHRCGSRSLVLRSGPRAVPSGRRLPASRPARSPRVLERWMGGRPQCRTGCRCRRPATALPSGPVDGRPASDLLSASVRAPRRWRPPVERALAAGALEPRPSSTWRQWGAGSRS